MIMSVRHSVNYSQVFKDIKLKFAVQISFSPRKVLNYFAERSEQKNIFTFFTFYVFFTLFLRSAPNHFSKLLISSFCFEAKYQKSRRNHCSSEMLILRSISSKRSKLLIFGLRIEISPLNGPHARSRGLAAVGGHYAST